MAYLPDTNVWISLLTNPGRVRLRGSPNPGLKSSTPFGVGRL